MSLWLIAFFPEVKGKVHESSEKAGGEHVDSVKMSRKQLQKFYENIEKSQKNPRKESSREKQQQNS